jgi:hypothetical protein
MEAALVVVALVAALWWVGRWTRTPAPPPTPATTTRRPRTEARPGGVSQPTAGSRPQTAAEREAQQLAREDAAFIEGMVVGHYVWPPDLGDREEPDGRDHAVLAWALGDDPDTSEQLDVLEEEVGDGDEHRVDDGEDSWDGDRDDDWDDGWDDGWDDDLDDGD